MKTTIRIILAWAFALIAVPLALASRLVNISTLTELQAGGSATAGFVVSGTEPKKVLIRVVGPGLSDYGISNVDPNPKFDLYRGQDKIYSNDNWENQSPFEGKPGATAAEISAAANQTGAFPLKAGSKDAATLVTLTPGLYTAISSGVNGAAGSIIIEVYEVSESNSTLVNISTLTSVGPKGTATAGFVIIGSEPKKVLIRAIGPRLSDFGVGDVNPDPVFDLYRGQDKIYSNDDWEDQSPFEGKPGATAAEIAAAAKQTGAFPLKSFDEGGYDSATLVTLTPGLYTVRMSGSGGLRGALLVEVYDVP